jgi:hypothetical protein
VSIEITKLIWQNVGVWNEVKGSFAELFLHADHVVAETVFPGDLVTLREVVDLLVLIQALIEVALAR